MVFCHLGLGLRGYGNPRVGSGAFGYNGGYRGFGGGLGNLGRDIGSLGGLGYNRYFRREGRSMMTEEENKKKELEKFKEAIKNW